MRPNKSELELIVYCIALKMSQETKKKEEEEGDEDDNNNKSFSLKSKYTIIMWNEFGANERAEYCFKNGSNFSVKLHI